MKPVCRKLKRGDMETQKQGNSEHYQGGYQHGYQGYSSGEAPKSEASAKAVERDMSLLEYDLDKDYILAELKRNLKEQDFDSAQELVHKFRAAAKGDEQFELLARKTADGINKQKDVERIMTSFEMTPENDYEVRLSLSERMYKIIPSKENLDRINHYRKALHKPVITSDAAMSDAKSNMPAARKAVRSGMSTIARIFCFSGTLGIILWWGLMFSIFKFPIIHPSTLVAIVAFIVHAISYYRLKTKEETALKSGAVFAQNFAINLVAAILIFAFA